MSNNTETPRIAHSLQEVITLSEMLACGKRGCWFRGHSDTAYELIPSVFRRSGRNQDSPYYDEAKLLEEFVRRHPQSKHEHTNTLELLTYAQHYGLPTRLLDWTENLLVAVYFACCEHYGHEDERLNRDGEVFTLASPLESGSPFDTLCHDFNKDLILSCIEQNDSYSLLMRIFELVESNELLLDNIHINGDSISQIRSADLLTYSIRNKTFDVCYGKVQTYSYPQKGSCFSYYPPHINERLISQSGRFTVHAGKVIDNHDIIPISPLTHIKRGSILIPHDCKPKILESLKKCGIDRSKLFPELEYQTQEIKSNCLY